MKNMTMTVCNTTAATSDATSRNVTDALSLSTIAAPLQARANTSLGHPGPTRNKKKPEFGVDLDFDFF
jgi:hypothetical protein